MEYRRTEIKLSGQLVETYVQSISEVRSFNFDELLENKKLFILFIHRGFTFYKMSNLDNRISNADQLLTNDIDKFCESVTDFYSNASKPLLDIIIYMYRLTTTIGAKVMIMNNLCRKIYNGIFFFKHSSL